ncbi:MAG: hypothetical protein Q9218_006382 [Villophora microphyllina]
MDRLPPEVLQQVCFTCDIATAKSLRCCSSRFDELAARAIFRDIYVAKLEQPLRNMSAVARHAKLRHYVHRIYFFNALLNDIYDDFEIWELNVDLRESFLDYSAREGIQSCEVWNKAPRNILLEYEEPTIAGAWARAASRVVDNHGKRARVRTIAITPERLQYHHERMQFHLSSQRAVIDQCLEEQAYDSNLGAFSRLSEVKIYGSAPLFNRHETYDLLSGSDHNRFPIESALHLDTLIQNPWDLTEVEEVFVNTQHSDIARSTFYLLKALEATNAKLRSLDFGILPWSIWQENADLVYWPNLHMCASNVMKSLQDLSVRFFLITSGDWNRTAAWIPFQISEFLNAAMMVETVTMYLVDKQESWRTGREHRGHAIYDWEEEIIADVSQILERVRWPRLRVLRMGLCGVTGQAFTTFMKRHSDTLRVLIIGDLQLVVSSQEANRQPSDWQPIMEAVAPLMSLDKVEFTHILDEVQEENNIRVIESSEEALPDGVTCGQTQAARKWKEHGRQVSEWFQNGGSGKYPTWFEGNGNDLQRRSLRS